MKLLSPVPNPLTFSLSFTLFLSLFFIFHNANQQGPHHSSAHDRKNRPLHCLCDAACNSQTRRRPAGFRIATESGGASRAASAPAVSEACSCGKWVRFGILQECRHQSAKRYLIFFFFVLMFLHVGGFGFGSLFVVCFGFINKEQFEFLLHLLIFGLG